MTWFYQHPSGDAYYNDVEESACAWLRELMIAGEIAPGIIDNRSILGVQPTDLIGFTQCHFFAGIGGWSLALRLANWPDSRPVWTGSPPCQPFSVAGENKGKDDERHLAPHFIGLVRACRPRVLFGEQVASSAVFGKVAKGRRGSTKAAPEWAWIDDLSDRLEAARYATWAVDFPSANVGAPHIRQRTYFGAVDTLWVADAASPRSLPGAQPGIHCKEESAGARNGESERCDATNRLADAHGAESQQLARQRAMPDQAPGAGTHGKPDGSSHSSGMADTKRDGQRQHGQRVGSASGARESETWQRERFRPDSSNGESACGVVHSVGPRLEGQRRNGDDSGQSRRDDPAAAGPVAEASAIGRANAPDNFWSDCDWLFCRDGKWRPVEPGTFPLAHGIPGRVGLLRGYGNAINPWQAAEFIEESAQALAETGPLRLMYRMTADKKDIFG